MKNVGALLRNVGGPKNVCALPKKCWRPIKMELKIDRINKE
jgi:hypothetical protein